MPFEVIDANCKDRSYCQNVTNYPQSHIEKLISENLDKFVDVFGSDVVEGDVITRDDESNDEVKLCDSYEEVIYPQSAQREDGSSWFVVNTDKHKQGIRIVRCLNAMKPCKMLDNFPNNYRSECKQNYVFREMIALTPEGAAEKEKFKFPACCSCVLHKI